MRLNWNIVLFHAVVVLVSACFGRSVQPSGNTELPDRTVVHAQVQKSIEASEGNVGKEIELVSTADIRDAKGIVLIPKRAKLVGHVTQAVPWAKDNPESRLSIIVERAEWKGHSLALHAFVAGDLNILTSTCSGCKTFTTVVTTVVVANSGDVPLTRQSEPPPMAPHLFVDETVNVRMASSKVLVSEIVSKDHTVTVGKGSTLSLRQLSE